MSTAQKPFHVLIVGAGLAGLTLAQALRKQGISFEVFERDASINSRFQGWSIALHRLLPDFRASLPEDLGPVEVASHLLPLDKPAQFVFYKDGKVVSSITSCEEFPIVRANRSRLRDYLAQNIDIKWDKNWTSIEEGPDSVTLHFSDGSSATGDILVGADGVHSKVRGHKLSGEDPLNPLPLALIVGEVSLPKNDYERIMTLGHSAFTTSQDGTMIFCGLNSVDPDASHAHFYWMCARVETSLKNGELPWTHRATQSEQYAEVLRRIANLDPKITELLRLTGEKGISASPLVIRDLLLDDLPVSRLTLVGDAVHSMAPNRGEGGNVSMQDSLNLARTITQIASSKDDKASVMNLLKEYQEEVLKRSRPVVIASRNAALDPENRNPAGHFEGWRKQLVSSSTKVH